MAALKSRWAALTSTPARTIVALGSLLAVVPSAIAVVAITSSSSATALIAEPAANIGANPFAELTGVLGALKPLDPGVTSPSVTAPVILAGNKVGLYGGTLQEGVCDPGQLARFLAEEPDKARAWAKTLGVEVGDIASYVATLTPVLLRVDLRVTNHGYADGEATPRDSILQRGTAVMIDPTGQPRVRCRCGNPLTAPESLAADTEVRGARWEGFNPTTVYAIAGAGLAEGFVLHQASDDSLFFRPVGTSGEADRPSGEVPAVQGLSEEAAGAALRDAGFRVGREARDSMAPAGTVIGTQPPAGTPLGRTELVTLLISTGLGPPAPLTVPDLIGRDVADARSALQAAGIAAGEEVLEASDAVPAGAVTRTDPPAGSQLTPATAVTVFVSSGPAAQTTEVPRVDGRPRAAAERALRDAGFSVIVRFAEDPAEAGTVIRSAPPGGAQASLGSAVSLTISSGPAPVRVPELVGRSEGEAVPHLRRLGLVEDVRRVPSEAPTGTVVSQDPGAETDVPPGTRVTISVSSGRPAIPMPNVRGMTEERARQELRQFEVVVHNRSSESEQRGTVLVQEPEAGTTVLPGTTVTLVVSTRPGRARVPNLVDRSRDEAVALVNEADLQPDLQSESSTSVPSGAVIRQSPAGGSEVDSGSVVSIWVSTGRPTVTVRGVTGELENEALTQLSADGLQPRVLRREPSATVEANRVISQSPQPSTVVAPGTAVDLVISAGRPPVTVPRVVGATEREAQAKLAELGFNVATEHRASDEITAGQILDQAPAQGTLANYGSAVTIYVSSGPPLVVVPDVLGQSLAGARAKLSEAGFELDPLYECLGFDTHTAGRQDPPGGSLRPRGFTVSVTFDSGCYM